MQSLAQPQTQLSVPIYNEYWPYSVTYQIFVPSFADANGDGIGDLKGITARWDYLRNLGVETILLSPVFPSPSYHKYDVTDYFDIDRQYGSLESFSYFIKDAHENGFNVVLDMPLNHCSKKHPWFVDALKNTNSIYHNCFLWTEKPPAAEKGQWHLPKDEKGNPIGRTYYYGYFSHDMPDFNYDNTLVVEEAKKICTFWLQQGVDGFRMDAAQHIFKEHEKNVAFWKTISETCKAEKKNVYIVAEVGSSFSVIAPYLKSVDACFNFDLAAEIVNDLKTEDASTFALKMDKIISNYSGVKKGYLDAVFLTNHDQNRVMSEMKGNVAKAKLAATILFTLPGIPYIYYGEELGMQGQKPDENIREPFPFDRPSSDNMRTRWMKPLFNTEKNTIPAMQQMTDGNSIYTHYSRMINLRKNTRALRFGTYENAAFTSKNVLGYYRIYNNLICLVVHNVSGTATTITLGEKEKTMQKVLFQTNKETTITNNKITLAPYATLILVNQ